MRTDRPCLVCGLVEQLAQGVTTEVVLVAAILHGVAAGAIPGARPSLCPEHDLVRTILAQTVQSSETLRA
jgi:hypothetical protein